MKVLNQYSPRYLFEKPINNKNHPGFSSPIDKLSINNKSPHFSGLGSKALLPALFLLLLPFLAQGQSKSKNRSPYDIKTGTSINRASDLPQLDKRMNGVIVEVADDPLTSDGSYNRDS